MIKAVFFDIDGTLVPMGTGHIPAEVSEAIAAIRSKGIMVFIATGRHIAWIDNLGDTRFDGYVTVNGGMCIEADGVTCFHKVCVPHEDISRLADFAERSDMPLVVVPAEGDISINRVDESVEYVSGQLHIPPILRRDVRAAIGRDVVQLMAFGSEEKRRDSGLFSDVLLNCEPTSWNPWFCDIIPTGSDKAVGVETMARRFGIDMSETMAFGDGTNDIGMIRAAGIGVAMGNGRENVKAAADYVTTDILDNGVVNALRHFGLL